MFIRADLVFNLRADLNEDDLEAVWADILFPKSKPILVGVCYRPPEQNDFLTKLENLCSKHNDFVSGEVIITGDFNIDVSRRGHPLNKAFQDLCSNHNFKQLIDRPTRITNSSNTTIDLILVTDKPKIANSGVIHCGLSDHSITFCTHKAVRAAIGHHNTVKIRSLKNYNSDVLKSRLSSMDWSPVYRSMNVDTAWGHFKSLFMMAIDESAPEKTMRTKIRQEPWMNPEILAAIKSRNYTFSKFSKNRDEQFYEEFKKKRNEVTGMIKKAKAEYFNDKIIENKSNPQQLWKCLKQTGYGNKLRTKAKNMILDIGGTVITGNKNIANCLNKFFNTIANTLVKRLPSPTGMYGEKQVWEYYRQKGIQTDSLSFESATEDTVLKKLRALNPNKATGQDKIPARFLRDAAESIASGLTHIINLSICQGQFPDDLKQARVIPLYKKGNKLDPGNYRPVSILSAVSKVIERIIHDQINKYLSTKNLLFELQSGFRTSHSTDTCLLYLTDQIRTEVDKGKFCGMVLLDLQKAFDTVNHNILLYKLKAMGFNNLSLRWMESYLRGRKQVVDINGSISSPLQQTCGVPQGSILGPLLFLLYVNDMKSACKCNLFLFADDAALMVSHQDKREIERSLSLELDKISQWLAENRLSLHLGKTEAILFGSAIRLKRSPGFKIMVGDIEVTAKEEVTYLGCVLDNNLSGVSMAQKVVSKINQRITFLGRVSTYINRSALEVLAGALIQCHYDYACSSWYTGITVALKGRLQTAQNKLARLILKLQPRTHLSQTHFDSLKWLRVEERVSQLKLCMVHNILGNTVPQYLSGYFNRVRNVHGHATRGSLTDLVPIRCNRVIGQNSFLYSAAVLWNSLPMELKSISPFSIFKSSIKRWIMSSRSWE